MSEIIANGDPLWDKIMRVWAREGRPTEVAVGNLVFKDIGDEKWVIARRVGDDMTASYGSRSISPSDSAKIDGPDAPLNFRPTF